MNKLALLSSLKIPEFIRDDYTALVAFVEAYFKFVETLESVGPIGDIDTAEEKYLGLYKNTVAKGFGDPEFLSIRKFIMGNKDFFERKGTPSAFEFFFKAYFGEVVEVRTPNYLIASGGEITGSYYFYITIDVGVLSQYDLLHVQTDSGVVKLNILDVVLLDSNTYAAYFNPPLGFTNQVNNVCRVYNAAGAIVFRGNIKKTPYKIVPSSGGKYWQVGQVIVLPSTSPGGTDTIARVTRIDSVGGIASIEIIKFGFPQNSIQYTVSSFDSSPAAGTVDVAELDETGAVGAKTYTLTVSDNIAGLTDNILGTAVLVGGDGYFSQDYQSQDFAGVSVLAQANSLPSISSVAQDSQQWLDSLATIKILYGALARERYTYLSENSLISNQNSKLHDNLFYQAFAYSIETTKNIDDYRGSIDLLHPAGMKFSATLNKIFDVINTDATIESSGFPHMSGSSGTGAVGTVQV